MWGARSVWLGCSRAVGWGDALSPVLNATINTYVSASDNPILFPCATPHLSSCRDRLVFSSKRSVISQAVLNPFPCYLPPVALNFQTAGMEMDLCDGLFSQNGCCGYVLKPPFMRDKETLFNPSDPSSREGPGPITLTIQVQGCGETRGKL